MPGECVVHTALPSSGPQCFSPASQTEPSADLCVTILPYAQQCNCLNVISGKQTMQVDAVERISQHTHNIMLPRLGHKTANSNQQSSGQLKTRKLGLNAEYGVS